MAPPESRTRFFPGNPLVGIPHRSAESSDVTHAQEHFREMADQPEIRRELDAALMQDAARRLTHLGQGQHMQDLDQLIQNTEMEDINPILTRAQSRIEAGDRRGYRDSQYYLFIRLHQSLENNDFAQARQSLNQFREITEQYQEYFRENTSLSTLERFRFLHAAGRIARTILARAEDDDGLVNIGGEEINGLRTILGNIYGQLLDYYRGLAIEQPDNLAILPLRYDIEMRQALLDGQLSEARGHAVQIGRHYQQHEEQLAIPDQQDEEPLPMPEDPVERMLFRTRQELMEDGVFYQQVGRLHRTSDAEYTRFTINGLSSALLQTVASTMDHMNEESEETITGRYLDFSTVMTALIQSNPGDSLLEIVNTLGNNDKDTVINRDIEEALYLNEELNRSFENAQGDRSRGELLSSARQAARHILELASGPGEEMMQTIFEISNNLMLNRVRRLEVRIRDYPEIVTDLELAVDPEDYREAALELLRTGTEAEAILRRYKAASPIEDSEAIDQILNTVAETEDTSEEINTFLEYMLGGLQEHMRSDPEHIQAASYQAISFIAGLEDMGAHVQVERRHLNLAGDLRDEMDSTGYRMGRMWRRITQPASLITIAAGSWIANALEGFAITRAGALGRWGPWVEAGMLSRAGAIMVGTVSGIAMSAIGTVLHHRLERAEHGLHTDFQTQLRDFGYSALLNTVVFGGTMFAQQRMLSRFASSQGTSNLAPLTRSQVIGTHLATIAFGGALAVAGGTGLQAWHTGELSMPTWDMVAENYLNILMFEGMNWAWRRVRHRVAVPRELARYGLPEGQRSAYPLGPLRNPGAPNGSEMAPLMNPEGEAQPNGVRLPWLGNRVARFFSARINEFFTVLGEHRAGQIESLVGDMVRVNPELAPHRDFIRYQLAFRESMAPGTLREFGPRDENGHYEFFQDHRPVIEVEAGNPRLVLMEEAEATVGEPTRLPPNVYESIQNHLENHTSGEGNNIWAAMTGRPGELLRIYMDPETNQILSINQPPPARPELLRVVDEGIALERTGEVLYEMNPEGVRALQGMEGLEGMEPLRQIFLREYIEGRDIKIPEYFGLEVDVSVLPSNREISLPPLEGTSSERGTLQTGHILEYFEGVQYQQSQRTRLVGHEEPIAPFRWDMEFYHRLGRLLESGEAQGPEGSLGRDGSRRSHLPDEDAPINVIVAIENNQGQLTQISVFAPDGVPTDLSPHAMRFRGRFNPDENSVHILAPRDGEGEVVINLERWTMEIQNPEEAPPSARRSTGTEESETVRDSQDEGSGGSEESEASLPGRSNSEEE